MNHFDFETKMVYGKKHLKVLDFDKKNDNPDQESSGTCKDLSKFQCYY